MRVWYRVPDQPLAHPPLVFGKQHRKQQLEPVRLTRLYLRQGPPEVIRDVAFRQAERKERPQEPAPPSQVPNSDDIDAASTLVGRRRANLPCAAGSEDVGLDDGSFQHVRLRPIVAKPFPDESDWPSIALGHIRPGLAAVVNGQMLGVNVTPQLCPTIRKSVAASSTRSGVAVLSCTT
jgi:hypothetical protein